MTTDEPEVKDVDVVHIQPAGKDAEDVDEPEETGPESSQEETEGEEDESTEDETEEDESDEPDNTTKTPEPVAEKTDDLAELEGETPKERALRFEVTRVKALLRSERKGELFEGVRAPEMTSATELTPAEKAIVAKYKPEELGTLEELFPVLAKKMGFVRQDDLNKGSYAEKSQDVLDTFLEKHPEYLPENDKAGTLWGAFKTEFSQYKIPVNPKDYARLFDKVHREVFGIKPGKGTNTTINAQREKVNTASHTGTSSKSTVRRDGPVRSTSGLRLDALKGFTDEEKDAIAASGDEE